MKKILKLGSTKKYRAKCPVCDTEFEYQRIDVAYSSDLQGPVVECPDCGSLIHHQGNPSSNITTERL